MKRYRVTSGPVQFGAGQVLQLSPAQVALRALNLSVGTKDPRTGTVQVTVVNPVQFKQGELIWLPHVGRALEDKLEDAATAEARAAAAEEAERRRAAGITAAVEAERHRQTAALAAALPSIASALAAEIGVDSNQLAASLMRIAAETFPEIAEAAAVGGDADAGKPRKARKADAK
jgi:hypothetical protein